MSDNGTPLSPCPPCQGVRHGNATQNPLCVVILRTITQQGGQGDSRKLLMPSRQCTAAPWHLAGEITATPPASKHGGRTAVRSHDYHIFLPGKTGLRTRNDSGASRGFNIKPSQT